MSTTTSWRGRIALMAAHCAGMVDMVALPLWVGTLIARYGFDPQQAGALVTLFLAGVVAASLMVAPRFQRLPARMLAPIAFACAALAFFAAAQTRDFTVLAALHALGGLAAGTGLSLTHGTIGRSANPHQLFGLAQLALGVFAVVFFAATPQIIGALGGAALFQVFGSIMALAALLAVLSFPLAPAIGGGADRSRQSLPREVWFGIAGISCMALTQAMMFSFFERIGAERGFAAGAINGLLVAIGLVNLFPAAIATALQRKLDARTAVLAGVATQGLLAVTLAWSTGFAPYAVAGAVFVFVMIFSHTFAFGLLATLDPTGRAVAATPAMLMVGAAIGPVLGGTLVKLVGYPALGAAAIVIDLAAVVLFSRLWSRGNVSSAAAGAR
jgi:predicted MFS family arabinose efflux permease